MIKFTGIKGLLKDWFVFQVTKFDSRSNNPSSSLCLVFNCSSSLVISRVISFFFLLSPLGTECFIDCIWARNKTAWSWALLFISFYRNSASESDYLEPWKSSLSGKNTLKFFSLFFLPLKKAFSGRFFLFVRHFSETVLYDASGYRWPLNLVFA